MVGLLDLVLAVARPAFFWAAVALAVVCVIDWLARTRRISPFGAAARFCRTTVDPLMAPVERAVVRAGGLPTAAPLWSLVAAVVGGIVVISLLGFVRDQVAMAGMAASSGPRGILRLAVAWTFQVLRLAIIVRIVCSWVRVSEYSRWVRWAFVLSEPILGPLRRIVPTIGMIDISPIVAYLLLGLAESALMSLV